jgi:hypothetical protein
VGIERVLIVVFLDVSMFGFCQRLVLCFLLDGFWLMLFFDVLGKLRAMVFHP